MSIAIRDHTPDTSEHIQTDRLVLDLPNSEGWKAELTQVVGYTPRCLSTVTHQVHCISKKVHPYYFLDYNMK